MQIDGNFDMLASNKYKYDNEIINILLVGSDGRLVKRFQGQTP